MKKIQIFFFFYYYYFIFFFFFGGGGGGGGQGGCELRSEAFVKIQKNKIWGGGGLGLGGFRFGGGGVNGEVKLL